MFRPILDGIRQKVAGTLAISLIGLDGIAIETINDRRIPLDVLGAEFGGFIKSLTVSNTELETGEVEQFALTTEKFTTILSAVTSEYFVLMVISRDGNYGRARFELAKARQALREELM